MKIKKTVFYFISTHALIFTLLTVSFDEPTLDR